MMRSPHKIFTFWINAQAEHFINSCSARDVIRFSGDIGTMSYRIHVNQDKKHVQLAAFFHDGVSESQHVEFARLAIAELPQRTRIVVETNAHDNPAALELLKDFLARIVDDFPEARQYLDEYLPPQQDSALSLVPPGVEPGEQAVIERRDSDIEKRRQEIKALWLQGKTNQQIAFSLSTAVATVKRDLKEMDLKRRK